MILPELNVVFLIPELIDYILRDRIKLLELSVDMLQQNEIISI